MSVSALPPSGTPLKIPTAYVAMPSARSPPTCAPMSRFGASDVGKARSANGISVADMSRSRPNGGLNLPILVRSAVDARQSTYASWITAVPPPQSGMMRTSKAFASVASKIGRARRIKKVLVSGTSSSPEKNRPST
jgi:hypothetical protein